MNWQERAEKAEDVLRSLASFVGAGGYNADKVDADVFEEKIRWGIGEIMTRVALVPAPAVPATCNDSLQVDIREMLQWLIDQRGKHGHNHKQSGIWDDDNGAMAGKPCEACAMYDKARALLQSAPQSDKEVRHD